jgi:hypothetical protein
VTPRAATLLATTILLLGTGAGGRARADAPPPPPPPPVPSPAPVVPTPADPKPAPAPKPLAAKVLAAIVEAAVENARRPAKERATGDALFDLCVRRGAAAAEGDPKALLTALAKAIDSDDTLARFPLTSKAFRGLETADEAATRRAVIGVPTLRGRADRALHFVVSAALAALVGEPAANAAGLAKELADLESAEKFSVGDLLADAAGVVFARRLAAGDPRANLARVAAEFTGVAVVPDDAGLPDALSKAELEKAYGGVTDPRFRAMRADLFARVDALPWLSDRGQSPVGK